MKKYALLLGAFLVLSLPARLAAQPGRAAPRKAAPAPVVAPTYYLVLLKTGRKAPPDAEAAATTRAAHMAYLQQLRRQGKLALAGSCPGPAQALQTMYLLRVATLGEAQGLTAADPSVKMGRLLAEVYPWVGQPGTRL